MSLESLLNRYVISAQVEGKSQRTIDYVCQGVRLFDQFLGGISDVRKVDKTDLKRFIIALRNKQTWSNHPLNRTRRKLSEQTIATYVKAIKSFWSFLEKEGVIRKNPLKDVATPKVKRALPKVLSEQELLDIISAAAKPLRKGPKDEDEDWAPPVWALRNLAIVLTLIDTGIRLGELINAKLSDLDWENGTLLVSGKTGQRLVPLSPMTLDAIVRYHHHSAVESEYLFFDNNGDRLTKDAVEKTLARIGNRAGLTKRLSPHKLRHSAATIFLRNTNNVEAVRMLLGHRNISTTQVYAKLSNSDLVNIHRHMGPVRSILSRGKIRA